MTARHPVDVAAQIIDGSPHRVATLLSDQLQTLEIAHHNAYWDSQVDATEENERKLVATELAVRRAKGDPAAYQAVLKALEEEPHDPLVRRQLEVLRASLAGNQMDEAHREQIVELSSSVETDFAAYRPRVDGNALTDNEIEDILKFSDDESLRRSTWEASKEIGGVVADRVRELARLRNSVAHDLGYADFFNMSLDLEELSETWLFDVLDQVEEVTEEPYREWKRSLDDRLTDRFGTSDLWPWHYSDPFFQQLPKEVLGVSLDSTLDKHDAADLARKTFAGWGLDITGVLNASDLRPRERKSQHAFCIDIDRTGKDVRILANVVPGERWIAVILHESGHAAYDISIDRNLPYLLRRYAHLMTTEAMALFAGSLVREPSWLADVAGVPEAEVVRLGPQLKAATVAEKLVFARWNLVVTHFERALYADPESDLNSVWWDLVARFQDVRPPDGRDAPDWAAKIHVAVAPAYYHNYLLGELTSAQLREACLEQCGSLLGRECGELLVDRFFSPGASMRWDALIEQTTGRGLSADAFASTIAR